VPHALFLNQMVENQLAGGFLAAEETSYGAGRVVEHFHTHPDYTFEDGRSEQSAAFLLHALPAITSQVPIALLRTSISIWCLINEYAYELFIQCLDCDFLVL
jgi:hypothetical protein